MTDNNSSRPIPEGWKFEIKTTEDGSKILRYVCLETEQQFSTYDDMMRYVNYARVAQLPIYLPNFDFGKDDKLNINEINSELILNSAKVVDLETFLEKPSALGSNGPKFQFVAKPKVLKNNKKRGRRPKTN